MDALLAVAASLEATPLPRNPAGARGVSATNGETRYVGAALTANPLTFAPEDMPPLVSRDHIYDEDDGASDGGEEPGTAAALTKVVAAKVQKTKKVDNRTKMIIPVLSFSHRSQSLICPRPQRPSPARANARPPNAIMTAASPLPLMISPGGPAVEIFPLLCEHRSEKKKKKKAGRAIRPLCGLMRRAVWRSAVPGGGRSVQCAAPAPLVSKAHCTTHYTFFGISYARLGCC